MLTILPSQELLDGDDIGTSTCVRSNLKFSQMNIFFAVIVDRVLEILVHLVAQIDDFLFGVEPNLPSFEWQLCLWLLGWFADLFHLCAVVLDEANQRVVPGLSQNADRLTLWIHSVAFVLLGDLLCVEVQAIDVSCHVSIQNLILVWHEVVACHRRPLHSAYLQALVEAVDCFFSRKLHIWSDDLDQVVETWENLLFGRHLSAVRFLFL